jgi:hypothetical protein
MNLDCEDSNKFIEKLFALLSDAGLCFLSGSIIIDDDKHQIFKSLYQGKGTSVCENIYKKERPLGTHLNFLDKNLFNSRMRYGYELKTLIPRRQYEKVLSPRLNYICDSYCKYNETEECMSNKASKGVLLFYPFEVENKKELENIPYIFLKLEGYVHDDKKHFKGAISRYILKKEKKDKYSKRREDDVIDENIFSNDEELLIKYIKNYYRNILDKNLLKDFIEIIRQKIKFYNSVVRSSNELYIPSEIFLLI